MILMKRTLFFILLLISSLTMAQNDSKTAFQKSRYTLAVSYYEKHDYKKAIDLFNIASKMKPENEISKESARKVDTLKAILRKEILTQAIGTWKMTGDKPVWAVGQNNAAVKEFDEVVEVKENEIEFYQINKKTQEKKLTRTEKIVYNNEELGSLFSGIILSDGTIWNCMINENADELRAINVGVKDENGLKKIESDNRERFFIKIK